jgi:Zn-dependent protease with chaperone function
MEIKYYKRRHMVSSALRGIGYTFIILGGLFVLGSVGAFEKDTITFLQWIVQTILSILIASLALPTYMLKVKFDTKYPHMKVMGKMK